MLTTVAPVVEGAIGLDVGVGVLPIAVGIGVFLLVEVGGCAGAPWVVSSCLGGVLGSVRKGEVSVRLVSFWCINAFLKSCCCCCCS